MRFDHFMLYMTKYFSGALRSNATEYQYLNAAKAGATSQREDFAARPASESSVLWPGVCMAMPAEVARPRRAGMAA